MANTSVSVSAANFRLDSVFQGQPDAAFLTCFMLAGVCFYQRESLPGYSAIFRHPNDELNFCYYLIPCGKQGWCGDVQARHCLKPCLNCDRSPSSEAS